MSLKAVFYPESIVVIGASTREGSVGHELASNLISQDYKGKLFLVNPKGGELLGKRLLTDLIQIKTPVDLAVVIIPAAAVLAEVERLAQLPVKAIVVISAGFKEVGNGAAEIELTKICARHDITLIGPNCLGAINPEIKLNASFAPLMPSVGSIAFVSQSGAICASILDYAQQRQLGFSKFISVGNKAAVGEAEILEYLYHDHKTKVIALYVEQLADIDRLRTLVPQITHGVVHKPIIILKAGRTSRGQQAAQSHTGALGSSDQAYEALFAQTGMIRAETIDELFDLIECFERNRGLRHDHIAVITNAGGPGVLTTDALIANGLRLAQLTPGTQQKLRAVLPAAASVQNPIDILGDAPAQRYEQALELVLADPQVNAVQVILTPQSMTEIEATAQAIVKLKKQYLKPIVVTFMGQDLVQPGLDILNKNQVANSYFPEAAARALGALKTFQTWLQTKRQRRTHYAGIKPEKVATILARYAQPGTHILPMPVVFEILKAYGLPMIQHWLVTDAASAEKVAAMWHGPLVLKINSPDINHKSDVGGVVLNVAPAELAGACAQLVKHIQTVQPDAKLEGVLVMPMQLDRGLEVILGVSSDPQLGKQMVVGLGGIYAEVFQDVSWGLAPLTSPDITRMLAHLKISKILAGWRGQGPLAIEVVEACLGRLSQLVTDFPVIKELDINPLKVLDQKKGGVILDARIVVGKS